MELHAFERLAQSMSDMTESIEMTELSVSESTCTEPEMQPTPMTVFPDVTPPGMAYVPYQLWGDVYDSATGLRQGTLFPVLDFPFQPEGGNCK